MRSKRSKIAILVLLLLAVSVGYAFLSTTLKIKGTTKVKSTTWNVYFDNIDVKEGSVVADEPELSENDTKVTFDAQLKEPGDYYEFTVDIVNEGSINAMIELVTKANLTETQAKYVNLTMTYEDGTEIKAKDLLASTKTETILVSLEYKKNLSEEDLPQSDVPINISLEIEYVQADDTAVAVAHKPLGPVAYYEFGLPTTDSTTDYTTIGKNVFVKLEGEQKSVCIIRNSELVCFKNNNVEEEQNHVEEVFGEDSCDSYGDVDCTSGGFGCSVYSDGIVTCVDSSTFAGCNVDSDGDVNCFE